MKTDRQLVIETTHFLKQRITDLPSIGFLTGTGLSDTLESLEEANRFEYSQLPNFTVSTVEGHKGRLVFGSIANKQIVMMQGRFHLYEGYSPAQVTFPVRVMQELGVKILIISNAAGGINLNFSPGDIMIISDHINLTGKNPLTGPNEDAWGIRFPDMVQVYDPSLMALTRKAAENIRTPIQTGVYAGLLGPSLETPAETRYLKTIGSDAVGFSSVMEAIAGVHGNMKILGLSLITNINDPDNPAQTTLEAVLKTARGASKTLDRLLCNVIEHL
ncbi:MAG: purine-nucleoside phosphorylase [Proteobacteria bacterium]|nr:purine-nucleoside phosphorylase [Pseudomonadota bacterium]MBU1585135.1 purine-nucleoside phosphorylase [Pseudomonadota bacterium]MBU2452966.1 purine-nucleoside phosphorylase [Pseudomonadota bacterium]MBU2629970.1 purine-nucleoside phosphorylase [Pseudomonadota bacterium]